MKKLPKDLRMKSSEIISMRILMTKTQLHLLKVVLGMNGQVGSVTMI